MIVIDIQLSTRVPPNIQFELPNANLLLEHPKARACNHMPLLLVQMARYDTNYEFLELGYDLF